MPRVIVNKLSVCQLPPRDPKTQHLHIIASADVPALTSAVNLSVLDSANNDERKARLCEGIQKIIRTLETGQPMVVSCVDDVDYAAIWAIGYLIAENGLDLASAYALVNNRLGACVPPRPWLASLIDLLGLPYRESEVWGPYFLASLLTSVSQRIAYIGHGLYLSSAHTLENPARAEEAGIEAILRVDDSHRSTKGWNPARFELCDLPISDGRTIDGDILRQGTAFIHQARLAGKRVLVQCQMGVSRSVTFALAYLVEYEEMRLSDACATILLNRPVANPHPALLWSIVRHYDLPYKEEMLLNGCVIAEDMTPLVAGESLYTD